MTIDFDGVEITRTKKVYENLCSKLHPNRIVGSSDKMYFIISTIVGQEWVTSDSSYGHFSITSDGFVVDNNTILGTANEFIGNVKGYIAVAELTDKQEAYFWELYNIRVHDWRIPEVNDWTFEVMHFD